MGALESLGDVYNGGRLYVVGGRFKWIIINCLIMCAIFTCSFS